MVSTGGSAVLGSGAEAELRTDDFAAYHRRLQRRFREIVSSEASTYPYPTEHCGLCDFLALCKARWEADDHLSLVAGIRRDQVERLSGARIGSLTALALEEPVAVKGIGPQALIRLRCQAELQLHKRRTGEHRIELLPLEPDRGFALLPLPDEGDIYLDLEGHPFFAPERGLEYLFGLLYREDGELVYEAVWARDREAEAVAFQRVVDFVQARRTRHPGLHVYHYGHYERTQLARLMGEHGTREEELDDLLRGEVLVDLYRVVRQGLQASVASYSIKQVEELYGFRRAASVSGGTESVVLFEEWLETGVETLLDGIRDYNEEDCRSLEALHRWLLELRPSEVEWRPAPAQREVGAETLQIIEERVRLEAKLLDGAKEGEPRWLLAYLLEYHRREAKPAWWEYFHHLELDDEELIDDGDTIGGLTPVGEPLAERRSLVYTFSFPAQEHKIGEQAVDPETGRTYSVRVDDAHGEVTLRRGANRANEPLPRSLIPSSPIPDDVQRDAVMRVALDYSDGATRFPALRDLLERRPPRADLHKGPEEAARTLTDSYLFVQGPPGSGKTYAGARMALALMRQGKRVGISAQSHKAIHKFLEDLEEAAAEVGYTFVGRKKSSSQDAATRYAGRFVASSDDWQDLLDPSLQLLAGTAWLFSRPAFEHRLDVLFIDEGGQVSLADTLAMGTAAKSLVLLGDPNQLGQVRQGSHPPGAGLSVLEHLLGENITVPAGMGLFLEETWRMRPELCTFVSRAFYGGRLQPGARARGRSIDGANGVRFIPVEHEGHSQRSPEEAEAVRAAIERLVGRRYVDGQSARALSYRDILVVAPFNAHVRCLRGRLPTDVRVGTVDKFQGQQAPVVFYSMASSSSEDVPRGLDFLFSRNRLNVAISRAECLAVLVASPRLLDATCSTIEQMRLANCICLLVEAADELGGPPH